MGSLGIELPPKTGRKNRDLIMEKRAMEPTGWDAPTGWGIGDELEGFDGSDAALKEEAVKRKVDRIVRSVGATPTSPPAPVDAPSDEYGVTKTKLKEVKKKEPKGEWTLDGGWVSHDDPVALGERTPLNLDELESEWQPTPLVGAQVIDRSDEVDVSRRWSYDDDDVQSPTLASTFIDSSSPSSSSSPSPSSSAGAKAFFDAADVQGSSSSSSFDGFSVSSPSIDLSGLGPGWLESPDQEVVSPGDKRAMLKDRTATFKRLGIRVPKVRAAPLSVFSSRKLTIPRLQNRARTVKDDWELLESWENSKSSRAASFGPSQSKPAPSAGSSSSLASGVQTGSRPSQEDQRRGRDGKEEKEPASERGPGRRRRKPWLAPSMVRSRRKDFLRY